MSRKFDYDHPTYLAAKGQAFARSDGKCQFSGQRAATEAHHWATLYPREEDTTTDDLTALCKVCHEVATTIRRFEGDIWAFMATFRKEH